MSRYGRTRVPLDRGVLNGSERAVRKAPVSPWPHTAGFILAFAGCAYLALRYHANLTNLAVMSVYGCGLLTAFGASALYHGAGGNSRWYAVFRRIDHASIYALMAATYTPVLYFGLDGTWRVAALGSVWFLATLGIVSKIWVFGVPRAVSTALYIGLGWLALVPGAKLFASLSPTAIGLILAGGVLYSIGALIYATRAFNFAPGRFGFHEVFHVFVVAGAATHFAAIAFNLPV